MTRRHLRQHLSTAVALASLTLCSGLSRAGAQVLTQRSVSLAMAKTAAEAALSACKEAGFDVTSAVVDRAGTLRVLLKADSASPHNAELARRKAFTALTFHITSTDFAKRSVQGAPLEAQRNLADVIALGGGVPILIGSEAIGGVGVSGTTTQEQDDG